MFLVFKFDDKFRVCHVLNLDIFWFLNIKNE